LVFIDETWVKTNMTRTHGRCPRGQRLIAKVPYGHWKTLTFVAALRCDGIVAPCVLRQPVNAISFLAWVTQFLVPTCGQATASGRPDPSPMHQPPGVGAAAQGGGGAALLYPLPAVSGRRKVNPASAAMSSTVLHVRHDRASLRPAGGDGGRAASRQRRRQLPVSHGTFALGFEVKIEIVIDSHVFLQARIPACASPVVESSVWDTRKRMIEVMLVQDLLDSRCNHTLGVFTHG
jgi:hypothetical protein